MPAEESHRRFIRRLKQPVICKPSDAHPRKVKVFRGCFGIFETGLKSLPSPQPPAGFPCESSRAVYAPAVRADAIVAACLAF